MMNSSNTLSEFPRKGMNLSALILLLLLLLELPVFESPLIHENLPLDSEPAEANDDFEFGQDFREA